MSFFYNGKLRPRMRGSRPVGRGPDRKWRHNLPSISSPAHCQAQSLAYLGELPVAKTATKSGAKRCSTKNAKKTAGKCAGETEVTIDRRRPAKRREEVAKVEEESAAPKLER